MNWSASQKMPVSNFIGSGVEISSLNLSAANTENSTGVKFVPNSPLCSISIPQRDELLCRGEFIHLNVMELPEMIYVETRFITQSTGTPVQTGLQATADTATATKVSASAVKVTTADATTSTDSPNPMRERGQQTEDVIPKSVTVSTQCNMNEECDFAYATIQIVPVATAAVAKESVGMRFRHFVSEKTVQYSSGKSECLICGEVTAAMPAMTLHMAMHWGPSALCHSCGRQFEHARLLAKHRCEMRGKNKRRRTVVGRFNCPYYRCRVMTISRLELYDHINEHSAQCCYHCTGCQRNFTTACELRHHFPLRSRCRKAFRKQSFPYDRICLGSKRDTVYRVRVHRVYSQRKKHVAVKSFLSLRMRSRHLNNSASSRRCQLCLKFCSNNFKFSAHNRRCLKYFLYRLQRKRTSPSPLAKQNEKQ